MCHFHMQCVAWRFFLSCSVFQTFFNTYILLKNNFCLAKICITWVGFCLQPKTPPNRVFWLPNYWGVKHTQRYFLGSPVPTNQRIPSNLYWAKVWCIFFEEQRQRLTPKFTSSTERKSNSPFFKKSILAQVAFKKYSNVLLFCFLSPMRWKTILKTKEMGAILSKLRHLIWQNNENLHDNKFLSVCSYNRIAR